MRKFTSLPAIVVLIAVLFTTLFIACRKTDQNPVEQAAVEEAVNKKFFYQASAGLQSTTLN